MANKQLELILDEEKALGLEDVLNFLGDIDGLYRERLYQTL